MPGYPRRTDKCNQMCSYEEISEHTETGDVNKLLSNMLAPLTYSRMTTGLYNQAYVFEYHMARWTIGH